MAFNLQNIARWSASMNLIGTCQWGYNGTVDPVNDDLATILTDGYFNSIAVGHLKLNDLIHVVATDGSHFVQVTAITPDVIVKEAGTPSEAIIKFVIELSTNNTPASQQFPVTGIRASDVVLATVTSYNGSIATFRAINLQTDAFTVIFDIDPGQAIQMNILIFRKP